MFSAPSRNCSATETSALRPIGSAKPLDEVLSECSACTSEFGADFRIRVELDPGRLESGSDAMLDVAQAYVASH